MCKSRPLVGELLSSQSFCPSQEWFDCHRCHNETKSDCAELAACNVVSIKCKACNAVQKSTLEDEGEPSARQLAAYAASIRAGSTKEEADAILCERRSALPNWDKCMSCGTQFGAYHCNLCNIWETRKDAVFHCVPCGKCKLGRESDYFHCETCNTCWTKKMTNGHFCCKDRLDDLCFICLDELKNSAADIVVASENCKHAFHKKCWSGLVLKASPGAPLCPACHKVLYGDGRQ